ncbi:uncharacterized protein LOC119501070 [Sebastes umbrosus]|uniref:uncharacterized protein LOC119501070 n=1 Tax=Sebastes umbrosus TaxID=72105 RepID=UPI00189CE000|nr:uncharacterized protein LOC119501070 [Sebastes umbrosus]
MNTCFIFHRVHQMRPSSFSEEERRCYKAEKMTMRQFMLMKKQDQVPVCLTVEDMKTWLLGGRSFLEEFDEITGTTEPRTLLMAELAWTTARRFCLSHMEKELLEELDKEAHLSQLFSRTVTLEGIHMLVSVVHSGAEEEVETLLKSLFSKLLKTFAGIQIASDPLSAEDTKPAELELEHSVALLVPQIVKTALKFLLEEPENENKTEAAGVEIGRLLTESAGPSLAGFGPFPNTLLLLLCTAAARCMVKAVYKKLDERSKTFQLMDYDDSSYTARESVVFAIKAMEVADASEALLELRTPVEPEEDTSSVSGLIGSCVSINNNDDTVEEESVSFFSFIWNMMTSCFCCCTKE